MKYLFLLAWIVLLLSPSCKKDKESSKQRLLSRMYEDGLLQLEYIYSSDRKPLRRNNYLTGTGQSVLSSYCLYQYTADGLLKEVTVFHADNNFFYKYNLYYDVNKRPVRMDDLDDDGIIQYYRLFDYGANGKISKSTAYVTGPDKKNLETFYRYNAQGQVQSIRRNAFHNNNTVLYDSATYVFGEKPLAPHWNYFEMLVPVAMPNIEFTFFHMTCERSFYYYVDAPPRKTNTVLSEKKYSGDGYLVEQQTFVEYEALGVLNKYSYKTTYEYVE